MVLEWVVVFSGLFGHVVESSKTIKWRRQLTDIHRSGLLGNHTQFPYLRFDLGDPGFNVNPLGNEKHTMKVFT